MAIAALRLGDPSQLGNYELTGRLGAGGQGVVYLGRGPDREPVAIKVLHGDVDESFLLRELSLAQQVASFCTAQVLESGVWGGIPYVVSEYIDGRPLSEVVQADGPRTVGTLERLAIGTVTALTAIHQAGVVHRDFKPANILLGPDGPRVIDFGIARGLSMTMTAGEIRGTPAYMAPEQISGQPAGTAADMFAWAVTMVYAATGHSPFESDTLPAVIQRVLYTEPDVSMLQGRLREQVTLCLSKDPAARPAAHEVLIRLLGHPSAAPADALREGTRLSAGAAYAPTHTVDHLAPRRAAPTGPPIATADTGAMPGRRPGRWPRAAVAACAVLLLGAGAVVALAVTGAFSRGAHQPAPQAQHPSAAAPPSPVARSSSSAPSGSATPSRSAAQSGAAAPSTPVPSTTPPPAAGIPARMNGTWTGTGHQPTSAVTPTFTIIMTLQAGSSTGTTLYPSLGCQGTLTLVPGSSGRAIRLDEQITSGGCTTFGQFTVQVSGGALSFTYAPDKPQAPASYGTLRR